MLWLSYCFLLNLGEGVESHISIRHTGVTHELAAILRDLSLKTIFSPPPLQKLFDSFTRSISLILLLSLFPIDKIYVCFH